MPTYEEVPERIRAPHCDDGAALSGHPRLKRGAGLLMRTRTTAAAVASKATNPGAACAAQGAAPSRRLLIVGPLPPPLGGVQLTIDMQLRSSLGESKAIDEAWAELSARWAAEADLALAGGGARKTPDMEHVGGLKASLMVGGAGLEPTTSCVSCKCSTN